MRYYLRDQPYERKQVMKCLWGLILTAGLMKATGGWGFAIVPLLAFYAVITGKTQQSWFWLVTANCMLMGNSFFMPKDLVFGIAHRGMMVSLGFLLTASIFGRKTHKAIVPLLWIFPYLVYMIIPSINGWAPIISLLKLLLFGVIFFAYTGLAKMALADRDFDARSLRAIFLASAIFFIVGSVLVMPFPGISYMSPEEVINETANVTLFKGMTWHSQTMGPLIAMLAMLLFCDLLFCVKRADKLYIMLLVLCPLLIYRTSSRTAMAMFLLGIIITLVLFYNVRRIERPWKNKVVSTAILAFVVIAAAVLMLPGIRQEATRFALKQYSVNVEDVKGFDAETFMSTRQFLIDEELRNWKGKPWIGNGFQVSYNMQFEKREGILSYLSAPIEKGVWVAAILEEGGIIGMILFCLFWIPASLKLWAVKAYMTVVLLLTTVVENFAEFCIFSMSSEGGFLWAMIFIAAIIDGKRMEAER